MLIHAQVAEEQIHYNIIIIGLGQWSTCGHTVVLPTSYCTAAAAPPCAHMTVLR